MNNFQYFDIDLAINDNRDIRGIILPNKIKMVLISDPDINKSICTVGVGAGYLQDEFEGTAHFLEHLLFMGNEKYPEQNEYSEYITTCGGSYNAFTTDYTTVYYLELDSSFLKKGIDMLSWFFNKPLLDMKHIKSESEIINSEHEKNLLNDHWIIDDLFKHFFNEKSKFRKFGTGSTESLKGITKEDIFNFYNKYYTTCNICVCIIDSKSLDQMINDYVGFFENIKPRFYEHNKDNKNEERFEKENLNMIHENLIQFKSVSEYNFLNLSLIFDADEYDQIDFQLVNLLCWFIGTEFKDSLCYYLTENNIIANLTCSNDYYYDYEAVINLKFIIINPDNKTINIITNSFNNLLNYLINLPEKDFSELYSTFQKVRLLGCMYSEEYKSLDSAISIVENLLKGEPHLALLRNYYVPQYNKKIYSKFLDILNNINIKLITNINQGLETNKKYIKSKWYDTEYYIDIFKLNKDANTNTNYNYNIMNLIGIKDFTIKTDLLNQNKNKKETPKLVNKDENLKREIYYLEYNKYDNPIGNVSIIRKNSKIKSKINNFIMNIYISICDDLINYYLEVMNYYNMNFSQIVSDDCIIYNFKGLNYIINNFVSEIIKIIHPDTIFNNPDLEKYFNKNIRDMKELLSNNKYDSPYERCIQYNSLLLSDGLLPDEQKKILNSINFDKFKNIANECLKYESETFIIIGIPDLTKNLPIKNSKFIVNQDINYLIQTLELNPQRYLEQNSEITIKNIPYKLKYKFDEKEINKNEKNNCLIQNFVIKYIKVEYKDNIITLESIKEIFKYQIITKMIYQIIRNPLFDKVRTEDKLGYIVKSGNLYKNLGSDAIFIVYYGAQSTFNTTRIKNSFDDFNNFFQKDIKNNKEKYQEQFESLKKSKIIQLEKPFSNLDEEVSIYLESFVDNYCIFDIKKIMLEVMNKIKFDDILNGFSKILNPKIKPNYIQFNTK